MPTIYVKKAFRLRHGGEAHDFAVGNHSVSEEVAKHWFVKAHTGSEPAVDPSAKAAADELMAELEGKAKELKVQADKLTEREKAAEAREADLAKRAEALDTREAALTEREKASEAAAKQQGGKK